MESTILLRKVTKVQSFRLNFAQWLGQKLPTKVVAKNLD